MWWKRILVRDMLCISMASETSTEEIRHSIVLEEIRRSIFYLIRPLVTVTKSTILFSISSHSAAGSDPATIPAPE